jgi:hypothetical protein
VYSWSSLSAGQVFAGARSDALGLGRCAGNVSRSSQYIENPDEPPMFYDREQISYMHGRLTLIRTAWSTGCALHSGYTHIRTHDTCSPRARHRCQLRSVTPHLLRSPGDEKQVEYDWSSRGQGQGSVPEDMAGRKRGTRAETRLENHASRRPRPGRICG